MQQLTGMDATFLHMETPATQGHVGSLTIFDAKTRTDAVRVRRDQEHPRGAPASRPRLRRRLVEVPLGPRSAVLDRGSRLRPRLPRPRDHAPAARRRPPARRRGGPSPRTAARPAPPPLGAVRHLGPGRRPRRPVHEDPPLGHRRRIGRRAAGRPARPRAEPRKVEPPEQPWQPESEPSPGARCCSAAFGTLATQPLKAMRFQRRTLQAMGRRDPGEPGARRDPPGHRQPRRRRSGPARPPGHRTDGPAEERGGRGDRAADAAAPRRRSSTAPSRPIARSASARCRSIRRRRSRTPSASR